MEYESETPESTFDKIMCCTAVILGICIGQRIADCFSIEVSRTRAGHVLGRISPTLPRPRQPFVGKWLESENAQSENKPEHAGICAKARATFHWFIGCGKDLCIVLLRSIRMEPG